MLRLAVVVIGDEILLGQVTDTNSGEIARQLAPFGWSLVRTIVVGDDASVITGAVEEALSLADLVITTGGLGPTKDDITKRVLMDVFGGSLYLDKQVERDVAEIFAKRGLELNDLTRSQALVPDSCRVISNKFGTAPIMWFERDGKVLVSMPGVPFETSGMMRMSVAEVIRHRFSPDSFAAHRTVLVSGITESGLAEFLSDWEDSLPEGAHLAYLPAAGYIRLRIDVIRDASVSAECAADELAGTLKKKLGSLLLYDGDASLAAVVLDKARRAGLTLATAESCTGGNIAHCITEVAGCSDCFLGGVVSYSNDVKEHVLGVPGKVLVEHGAVSEPVVLAMAEGAASVCNADCSVATSGIAGPGGGSPEKPVGTVWIAAHVPGRTVARCHRFPGNRQRVIERATNTALLMLASLLDG